MYAIMTGAIPAAPMPTMKRNTSSRGTFWGQMAMSAWPTVYRAMAESSILRRPMAPPSFPIIGAMAAAAREYARVIKVRDASAFHAVEIAVGTEAVKPPQRLRIAAAIAYGTKPFM